MLLQNRNLCEDIQSVTEVTQQQFRLCAELELKAGADPFDTVARMFFNIQLYLTPLISFYALKDLLHQGYTADVLFEGPLLTHGFIKEEELQNSALKTEIHLSDVMQQILDVDGVENILDIVFNASDEISALENKWIIPVAAGKQPVLNITDANVLIYKNGIPLRPDMNIIKDRFHALMANYITSNDQVTTEDIPFDTGTFTNTASYHSFQNHFPKNYGISHWGLRADAGAERRAQAKQLQGYLYFFDQQLANFASQLSHLSSLFSVKQETTTCFTQTVRSFKDAEDLFVNKASIDADVQAAAEDKATFYTRRNLFLDHLLSRFSESFFDYVSVLHSGFSNNPKDVVSPAVVKPEDIIQDKIDFLRNYPEHSSNRFCGYNYADRTNLWDTENISGLEKRLQRLLGFNNISRRNLVNLYSFIQHEVNGSDIHEYWFSLHDYQNKKSLLEGTRKYPGAENAAFDLEDALTALYNPQNLRIVQNADSTFSYQLFKGAEVIGKSPSSFTSEAAAGPDRQRLLLLATKSRAEEGMFLLEHMMLLPDQEDTPESPPASPPVPSFDGFLPICVDDHCKDCEDKDPYSFRISIVLPAYAPRFLNLSFRRYCEQTIRMEAPAHTFVKICWVGNEQLAEFQESYQDWLAVKAGSTADPGNVKLNRLVTILTALRTIYPVARLEDCRSSEERTLFLLNQNALGTLKT